MDKDTYTRALRAVSMLYHAIEETDCDVDNINQIITNYLIAKFPNSKISKKDDYRAIDCMIKVLNSTLQKYEDILGVNNEMLD